MKTKPKTIEDTMLGFTDSIIVHTLKYDIHIWKYKISDSKFGYYVATEQMSIERAMNCGCPYPKVDSKGRITSFANALEFANERIEWVERFIAMCSNDKPIVSVLNGSIEVH